MKLANANLTQLQTAQFHQVIIPLGATEQHGPYLPYNTDLVIAEYLASQLDDESTLVMPGVPYACSQEHEGFPGSIWIDYKLFMSYLEDICESVGDLSSHIALLSGHGGNKEVLELFRIDWNYKHTSPKVHILEPFTDAVYELERELLDGKVDSHAGNGEISIMLHIGAEGVTMPDKDVVKEPYKSVFGKHRVKDFYEQGILDKNAEWLVSKVIGEKIVTKIVEELRRQLVDIV